MWDFINFYGVKFQLKDHLQYKSSYFVAAFLFFGQTILIINRLIITLFNRWLTYFILITKIKT